MTTNVTNVSNLAEAATVSGVVVPGKPVITTNNGENVPSQSLTKMMGHRHQSNTSTWHARVRERRVVTAGAKFRVNYRRTHPTRS